MGLAAKWAARKVWTSGSRLSQERRGLRQHAILEALVELLTDGQGEAGDFAVARHRVLESVALFACGAMIIGRRQDVKPTEGF